jgi:hypothetical protein
MIDIIFIVSIWRRCCIGLLSNFYNYTGNPKDGVMTKCYFQDWCSLTMQLYMKVATIELYYCGHLGF